MSVEQYALARKIILGNDIFQLLSLGFALDSDTLEKRVQQLQNAGINVSANSLIELAGLGSTPNQQSTAERIKNRVSSIMQLTKNKLDQISDLEDLEFE